MRKGFPALLLAALFAPAPAVAQIKWSVTYSDGNITAGTAANGFADGTYSNGVGSATVGQLRRDSSDAALAYLGTVLDGRGTVRLNWNASTTATGSGTLASFGAEGVAGIAGTFQNGAVYQRARSNDSYNFPNPGPPLTNDGAGQVNFATDRNWHYGVTGTNTVLNSSRHDLVSVLAHEFGHALGVSAFSDPGGQGLLGSTLGNTDVYSMLDKGLQRGNVAGTNAMLNTTLTNSNYGSYNTAVSTGTYTGGNSQSGSAPNVTNNTTSGLYFSGTYANEVFGGVLPLYAPTTYSPGSSASHVNVGSTAGYGSGAGGLMNYSIGTNIERRFQAYEIALLMDLGWNVYNWNGTTGNMKDGVVTNAGVDTYTLSNSRWRTDSGIVLAANGSTRYNTNANQGQAPILPVYGQATANIVLNFGGTTYTATNDIGTIRVSRLNFTNSGAVTIAGGGFNFGLNADDGAGNQTASVLVPKIAQNGAGAVTISSDIIVNTIATQTVLGSTFAGHSGVTVEGTGGGAVTLSGNITGSGGLTKNSSSFNLTVSGTNNTYSGGTTINAGTLTVASGSSLGTGAVTINNGGTLARVGTGSISTGNVSIANGGTLTANLAASGTASQLNVGSNTFNFATTGAKLSLFGVSGFVHTSAATYTLALLSSGSNLQLNGVGQADGFVFGTFVQGSGASGAVTLDVSNLGTTLTAGDTFSLARTGNNLVLTFTPVPEPATVLAVGVAGLGAFGWLRRKRRAADPTAAA